MVKGENALQKRKPEEKNKIKLSYMTYSQLHVWNFTTGGKNYKTSA